MSILSARKGIAAAAKPTKSLRLIIVSPWNSLGISSDSLQEPLGAGPPRQPQKTRPAKPYFSLPSVQIKSDSHEPTNVSIIDQRANQAEKTAIEQ
jgi:hypothetical protein